MQAKPPLQLFERQGMLGQLGKQLQLNRAQQRLTSPERETYLQNLIRNRLSGDC
jgi:hypothetical protein